MNAMITKPGILLAQHMKELNANKKYCDFLAEGRKLNYEVIEDIEGASVITEYCSCGKVTDTECFETFSEALQRAAELTMSGWNPYRHGSCEEHTYEPDILDSYHSPCRCGGQRQPIWYEAPSQGMFCTSCGWRGLD